MTHRTGSGSSRPALRLAGLLLILAAAAAASSCSKKITNVDSALAPPDYPEGVPANSRLIVYPDVPVPVETWKDNGDPGPDTSDVLLSTSLVYAERAGAVLGSIVDHTPASQFQVFRRQGTNGYIELNDFALLPTRTYLGTQYDLFHFSDRSPFPAGQRQYIGRGIVSGVVTPSAPLTNVVNLTISAVSVDLQYLGRTLPDTTRDSTFVLRWNSVAGAAGYWLTVTRYPPSFLANEALIRFALPRPLPFERLPGVYLVYVPSDPLPSGVPLRQKIGDPLPAGSLLLQQDIGTNGALYFARIAAVDANGQLLATIGPNGSYAQAAVQNAAGGTVVGMYRLFPIGGVFIQPQAEPPPPPELAQALRAGPGNPTVLRSATLQNGVKIYDGDDLRRVLRR